MNLLKIKEHEIEFSRAQKKQLKEGSNNLTSSLSANQQKIKEYNSGVNFSQKHRFMVLYSNF